MQKTGIVVKLKNYVSHLSAQKKKKSQEARIFKENALKNRQKRAGQKAPKRQIPPGGLMCYAEKSVKVGPCGFGKNF